MWQVHVMAHVYGARAVLPSMIARGEGYLLTTASAAGLLTQMDSVVYAITKHAAVALAEWLAINHHHQGIRVSVLCPQAVRTAILGDRPARHRPPPGLGRRRARAGAAGRHGDRGPGRGALLGAAPPRGGHLRRGARPTTSTAGWRACAASRSACSATGPAPATGWSATRTDAGTKVTGVTSAPVERLDRLARRYLDCDVLRPWDARSSWTPQHTEQAMLHVLAAEGGYQEFTLAGGEWLVLIGSALTALIAIGVGFLLMKDVLRQDQGTPTMIAIATAIQVGRLGLPEAAVQDDRRDLDPAGGRRVRHVGGGGEAGPRGRSTARSPSPRPRRASSARSPSSPAASCPASPATSA